MKNEENATPVGRLGRAAQELCVQAEPFAQQPGARSPVVTAQETTSVSQHAPSEAPNTKLTMFAPTRSMDRNKSAAQQRATKLSHCHTEQKQTFKSNKNKNNKSNNKSNNEKYTKNVA